MQAFIDSACEAWVDSHFTFDKRSDYNRKLEEARNILRQWLIELSDEGMLSEFDSLSSFQKYFIVNEVLSSRLLPVTAFDEEENTESIFEVFDVTINVGQVLLAIAMAILGYKSRGILNYPVIRKILRRVVFWFNNILQNLRKMSRVAELEYHTLKYATTKCLKQCRIPLPKQGVGIDNIVLDDSQVECLSKCIMTYFVNVLRTLVTDLVKCMFTHGASLEDVKTTVTTIFEKERMPELKTANVCKPMANAVLEGVRIFNMITELLSTTERSKYYSDLHRMLNNFDYEKVMRDVSTTKTSV